MVVLRVHRRATSVPVGEPGVSEDTNLATQNSLLFSRAAIDNTDALSTASKRNDQQFLRDVNNLIGNSSFIQPYVKTIKRTHHGHTLGSPLGTRRRSIAVSSVLHPHVPLVDTSDVDVDYEVQLLAPITNRISRYGRATSVPPQPVTLTSTSVPIVTKPTVLYSDDLVGYNYIPRPILVSVDAADYHQTRSIYELGLQSQPTVTSSFVQKFNPSADLAVRQAHRHLDRIERELKSSGDTLITSRPTSPRTLVLTSYRDGPGSRRRSWSYHGPRFSTVRTRSPSPVSVAAPVRRTVRSTYTKTGTPVLSEAELFEYLPTSSLQRNIETDLLLAATELDTYPTHVYRTKPYVPLSYSSSAISLPKLPHVPSEFLRELQWIKPTPSADKVIRSDFRLNGPDSYVLPSGVLASSVLKKVSTGTHAPVVIHRVSPDFHALSLHALSPRAVITTPSTHTVFTHVPVKPPIVPIKVAPLPPAAPTPPGLPHVTRPKVSETRRKVRDVLCKVKGDPHYFDD